MNFATTLPENTSDSLPTATQELSRAPRKRTPWWRGPRFLVEVFDGADEALDALDAIQGGLHANGRLTSTGFQTRNWLTVHYEELARAQHARPRVVVVTERNSGEVALVLPLVIVKKRRLRVARFADLGVVDYGAPILGPAPLVKKRSIRRAWRAVLHALRDVDLIRLEKMPAEIGGRANPLIGRRGIAPSRRPGTVVTVTGSVDAFIAARGDAFRDAFVAAMTLLRKKGGAQFARAVKPDDIAHAFASLEEQQSARHAALGTKNKFADVAYRQFYERMVMDGTEVDLGYMFTLTAGGETIATLFGIEHDGTFTLLRLSHAGDAWKDVLPGRLICIAAMRYFIDRGVRRFDFGHGTHPFKESFGVAEVPLYDLIVARDLVALPRATFHRVQGRMRKNARLRAFLRRFRRREPA